MSSASKENLLERVPSALNVPPFLVQPGAEKLDSPIEIPDDAVFPKPTYTTHRIDARKRRLPQCIAHRGYKAAFPENTLISFKGAVEAGAHALETDVHLTKDDVVVLSHDATLKRCFGRNEKIIDLDWSEIEGVKTEKAPHESMPKLKDLLEYLAQPGLEDIWVLLDIKLSNDVENIMRQLAATIASVTPPARKPWKERLLLGIWAAKLLPHAMNYLPGFSVCNIGFSPTYSRHFFTVPHVSFNMLLPILIAPGGKKFIRDAQQKHGRQVYAWTVNEKDKMEWCIRRKVDGVFTDDPKLFLQICEEFDEAKREPWPPISLKGYYNMLRIYIWVTVASFFFTKWLKPVASQSLIRKGRAMADKK